MQGHNAFHSGMIVVCRDNENVESFIDKNEYYTVQEVSHRGALIKVEGISPSFASTRFVPMKPMPPQTLEIFNVADRNSK